MKKVLQKRNLMKIEYNFFLLSNFICCMKMKIHVVHVLHDICTYIHTKHKYKLPSQHPHMTNSVCVVFMLYTCRCTTFDHIQSVGGILLLKCLVWVWMGVTGWVYMAGARGG